MESLPVSLLFLLSLFFLHASADIRANTTNVRGLFLFKDVLKSNTSALLSSGFNALIIFGIGILDNGDIKYYSNTPGSSDVVVASNGSYVGGEALSSKVRSFKAGAGTGTTGVDRVEISMNSQHVKTLMSLDHDTSSRVYRNFVALKEAWDLDAVNNDDESLYDVASTVAFARMLGAIGYRYTGAPYTNDRFWVSVVQQVGTRLFDRVYLQCYDGGARNDPATWTRELGMKVVPLLWVTNDSKPGQGVTAAQARAKFAAWNKAGTLTGGGYWNDYDIEKMGLSYGEYGRVLRDVFP